MKKGLVKKGQIWREKVTGRRVRDGSEALDPEPPATRLLGGIKCRLDIAPREKPDDV